MLENSFRNRRTGDVIAGEEDGVWVEPVDAVDGSVNEERLSALIEMDIAQLRNAEAVECLRKTREINVPAADFDPMPLDFARVEG